MALAQEAVALDPTNARAHADLGMHLMRTGDETGARRSLDRAFRADPFDLVTYNLLQLLDTLDTFVVVREGDIILQLHPDEAAVMRDYVMPLAQDALKTLSRKDRFTPKGPILVEMFPHHDDFAVRTLGLPGMIGALGACFGRVVTLDSPRARQPGTFSWQATLWHEMAHVITLQMSQQRVPRWLTEGISVYEESKERPEWARHGGAVCHGARAREGVEARRPELGVHPARHDCARVFQASLLVDHIVSAYGEPKLQALVNSYGQGLEGNAAIEKTIGVSLDQLQASLDKALDARFGAVRTALRDAAVKPAGGDINALRAAAAAAPGSYVAQLALGQALAAAGDRAAFEPLEKAATLVPVAIGDDSPHAIMARLAEKLGDMERAMKEYQALLAQDHTAVDPARPPRVVVGATGGARAAARRVQAAWSTSIRSTRRAHRARAVRAANNDAPTAVREFKAALAIGPADSRRGRALRSRRGLPAGEPAGRREKGGAGRARNRPDLRARAGIAAARDQNGTGGGEITGVRRARPTTLASVCAAAAAGLLLWLAAGPSNAQAPPRPDGRFAGLQWTFARIRYTAWTVPPGSVSPEDEPWYIDAPAAEQNLLAAAPHRDRHPGQRPGRADDSGPEPLGVSLDLHRGGRQPPAEGRGGADPARVPAPRRDADLRRFSRPDRMGQSRARAQARVPGQEDHRSPKDHPIFHCFYQFDEFPQTPGLGSFLQGRTWEKGGYVAHLRAIEDDSGRAMVLINWNVDMGDGWEWSNAADYPGYVKYTAIAYRMEINEIVHSLTH